MHISRNNDAQLISNVLNLHHYLLRLTMKSRLAYGIIALLLFCITTHAQTLRIATYNLRNANGQDSTNGNGWGQRLPIMAGLIRFHDFDIFGTQEGLQKQLEALAASLPGYAWIGVGRDDGKKAGEHSAIFYKTDKFTVLKHGDFWLSAITDRPNKGWDAVLPRICTWAQFEEKQSHLKFFMFNLHMDHIGVQARRESAKLILSKIKTMVPGQPVILTGDFNVDQTSDSYQLLNTSGVLKDTYTLANQPYAPSGSFNDYNVSTNTTSRIDHIFVTHQFKVERYGILTDTYHGRTPSDHYPVMAELKFSKD